MENLDQGFDDIRFVDVVDEDLHCPICLNVLKQPIQCQNNEHHFCRPCIERHLNNFQTCPSCKEELTLAKVRKPSRYLTKQLLKLSIHCEYVDRGCAEVLQLEHLQIHIDSCGFAPVVCSNDGCGFLMNKHERIHHETEYCSYRKVIWTDYDDVRKERDKMKTRLDELNDQMRRMKSEMKHPRSSTRGQLAADACNVKEDIFIAGGRARDFFRLNSVERFRWSTRRWERSQPMKEIRSAASSVFYKNQMIVVGGYNGNVDLNNIETLNIEQQSAQWRDFPAVLTDVCSAHQIVVYKDSLFILGGTAQKGIWDSIYRFFILRGTDRKGIWDSIYRLFILGERDFGNIKHSIYQLLLLHPYSCELKSQMVQQRSFHGAALVDDKIVILGGSTTGNNKDITDGVEMYDICRNESKQMPPLPFALGRMATVSWRDSVVSIGGTLQTGEIVNTVLMYNVHGQITMLPSMKHKRSGCSAVITGNRIVVMGGLNREQGFLNSVECFSFDTYSWEELPPLIEARAFATSVVKQASKPGSKRRSKQQSNKRTVYRAK